MINMDELNSLVEQGYVDRIPDPEGSPLCIYNYGFRVQMDKLWTPLTLMCRGLVLDDKGQVIGRPFAKFFNVNERPETMLANLPSEIPEITEKRDGSLIIVFYDPYKKKWRCCTRGSWVSDQAKWAQKWLDDTHFNAYPHYTYMFELTAPWNRIVVLYKEAQMTLLAANHYSPDGGEMPRNDLEKLASQMGWPVVKYWKGPVSEINLSGSSFNNEEGMVVKYSNGLRVKMKYDSYCRLHKTMTGLSIKGIWESLQAGDEMDLSELPDEFMDWYKAEKGKLQGLYAKIAQQVEEVFAKTDTTMTRKDIAIGWKDLPGTTKSALFLKLDGRDFSQPIWKAIKPEVHKTFQIDNDADQ